MNFGSSVSMRGPSRLITELSFNHIRFPWKSGTISDIWIELFVVGWVNGVFVTHKVLSNKSCVVSSVSDNWMPLQ
jgi:hypothetical protein